ncbi:MAG: ATP-binding protein [Symploca sp. SIO2D2]|nr:ATP-binding protein [Symploca sp. SIO2D2]
MSDRISLLDQLNRLPDSQWEELLFRLEVESYHLRTGVTKSQQNIDLIKLFQQQESGLPRLEHQLRELAFFKKFIPAGTYPVGEELRQREEAREEEAVARGDIRGDYRITPEKFYSFQRGTEWLGVFREWDAPRSFREELLNTTIKNSQQRRRNCPATAIIGHGGSGKSVALRRLALDLVQGYQVWWVENPTRLIELGLDEFIDNEGKPQFLLIDEIQDLDSSYVERLRRHLRKYPFLVLVVAGRRLPNKLKLGAKDKFTPNEAADRITILDKIAEVLPAWATTAAQLKAESLREARLVRILVVLARRQEPVPKTLEELEEVFLQILVDDLERIREQFPGLATAIMDAAVFREVGMARLYRSVLITLADYHQPHASIPTLLAQFDNNPRWKPVTSLISYDSSYESFLFHHDELAEGLIRASQEELTQPYVDDAYRNVILDRVIRWATAPQGNVAVDQRIAATASWLLRHFVCQGSDLVNQTTALNYIHQLLNAEISHHAYLSLIVNNALNLEREASLNLLEQYKSLAKKWIQKANQHPHVLCRCLELLGPEAKKQALVLLFIPGQDKEVLCSCLNLLGPEAKEQALVLLSTPEQHPFVICSCLTLLGPEAKEQALVLLSTPGQDKEVLCSCLNLLGSEAKEQALVLLSTPGQTHQVLCSCLNLLGSEAKEQALVLLSTPEQDKEVLCSCLALLGQEAKKQALVLLSAPGQNSDVLCSCLALLGQEAKKQALFLLSAPGQNSDVLCSCLALLGSEAKEQALVLLSAPGQNSSVLCRCLELLGSEAKEQALVLLSTPEQDKEVLCRCLELLGSEAKEQAFVLLSTPEQDKEVLCRCLELLGSEAKEQALVLLSTPGQTYHVLCSCLALLGSEAKEQALVLLSTPGQTPEVLCSCLNLLGQEAKIEAQEKIASWAETNPKVLSQCFAIAGETPEAQKAAKEIFLRWQAGENLNSAHKIVALRAPFNTELRQQMALQVLNNWRTKYRPLVASALTAFSNDPDAVTNCCRHILKRWYQEIEYYHRNKRKFCKQNDSHIIKALAHPSLRRQVQAAARRMLETEVNSPGFLTPLLHQQALEITQGKFPSWTGTEEKETEPLTIPQMAVLRPSKPPKSKRIV